MRTRAIVTLTVGLGLTLAACKSAPPPEPSDTLEPLSPEVEVFTPASCEELLRKDLLVVQPGAKAVVDWSAVTTDREGQPLAPADVDELRLMFYALDLDTFIARNCGAGGLTTPDIAYVVQEGDLKTTASTPFDSTPFEGKTATLELMSQGQVRKYLFARMDAAGTSTTFAVSD